MCIGLVFYTSCVFGCIMNVLFLQKKTSCETNMANLYLKWTMETPIFIPRLKGWKQPNLDFSFKNVLKREYSGFFALFFTFGLFDLIENYTRFNQWYLDDFWAYSLCVTGTILRTLKKKTKIICKGT